MDEFEKRLKRDAGAIQATVPPELRARIDASLEGIEPLKTAPRRSHSRSPSLWWASSLTGLAAAAMVIVAINWNQPEPSPVVAPVADTVVPPQPDPGIPAPTLDIRTADFTSPLEEELDRLQSDIEKARESVRRDLSF